MNNKKSSKFKNITKHNRYLKRALQSKWKGENVLI
jgi:hypothetical protein